MLYTKQKNNFIARITRYLEFFAYIESCRESYQETHRGAQRAYVVVVVVDNGQKPLSDNDFEAYNERIADATIWIV
jgi:hypothetical protein